MTRTYCPICRTPFDVTDALIGQKGLCATCGAKFLITPPDQETTRESGRTTQPFTVTTTTQAVAPRALSAKGGIWLATLFVLVTAGVFAWLKMGSIPASLGKWISFLGQLHPLLIHYPVAWITAIFVLGIFGAGKHHHALRILLWLNLLTCAGGIVAGQCAAVDRADGLTLTRHFYAGLCVGGFSWLALLLFLRSPQVHTKLYKLVVLAAMGSVAVAGHFGATLTHGDVLQKLPWLEPEAPKIVSPNVPLNERTVLEAVVQPILNARCVGCHGPEKQKGNLRMDSHAAMLAKGESEKHSIVPADPNASESLRRILLPTADEEHMPPEKKPQMEPSELAVLTWWVQAGADPKLKLSEAPAPAEMKQTLQALAATPPK